MERLKINFVNIIQINDKTVTKNLIDVEVQRIFRPLTVMQTVTLNPKYHIKNNFINPNNSYNKLILISGLITFLTTYTHRIVEIILDETFRRYLTIKFEMFASIFDFVWRLFGFTMNFFFNWIHSKNSVLFILHFQDVHRFLKNDVSTKRFIIRSWMIVSAIFGFHILELTYVYIVFNRPPWNVMFYLLCLVTLDTNLIYTITSMNLLTDKVELWNVKLLLVWKNGCSKEESQGMFQAFDQIFKCYDIVRKMYQQPVSNFCFLDQGVKFLDT